MKRAITKQARSVSSLPESTVEQPESSRNGYLNTERKRKLVTLHHKTENFVTAENLSSYIDREFTRRKAGQPYPKNKYYLTAELKGRQRSPSMTKVSAADTAGWKVPFGKNDPIVHGNRNAMLKSTIYGVDVSGKASLEMAEDLHKVNSESSSGNPTQAS